MCALLSLLAWNDLENAIAAPIVITTLDNPIEPGMHNQGWWSNSSSNTNSTNISTLVGNTSQSGSHRSYATFYLPALSQQVVRATLFYDRRGVSLSTNEANETVGFFDVATNAVSLNTQLGPSILVYNDLGSGNSYGQFVIPGSGPSDDSLTFELNSTAVAHINSAGPGYFSIGGALLTNDGNDALFGGFGPRPTLTLRVIPEPATLTLLLVGAAICSSRCLRRPADEETASGTVSILLGGAYIATERPDAAVSAMRVVWFGLAQLRGNFERA